MNRSLFRCSAVVAIVLASMAGPVAAQVISEQEWPGQHFDQARKVPAGQLLTLSYPSNSARPNPAKNPKPVARQVVVYTPPGYSKKIAYPVLYLLHGRTGSQNDWSEDGGGRMQYILNNLYNARQIIPMIVVMPDNHGIAEAEAKESGEQIVAAYRQFETELLNELIPFIEGSKTKKGQYLTVNDASGRYIAGLSEGAEQAIWFGLSHPELFSRIGAFSPGADLVGGKAANFIPDAVLKGGPLPVSLYLSCGAEDPTHLKHTTQLTSVLDDMLDNRIHIGTFYEFDIFSDPGHPTIDGHVWPVWEASLFYFVQKLH